jgi:hypothetical protein
LTSGGSGNISSSSVANVFKVVVVLLVVSAATVLITPDTSDDVVGVLHLYEVLAAHVVFIGWLKAPEIVTVHSFGRETLLTDHLQVCRI